MFPAYKTQDLSNVELQTSRDFLQNPSYDTIPVTSSTIAQQITSSSESESSNGEYKHVSESVDLTTFKKKPPTPPATESFYIDRERNKTYLKLDFLSNRAVPFYTIRKDLKRFTRSNKGGSTFRRYFKAKKVKKLSKEMAKDPERLIDDKASKDEEMRIFLIKNSQDVEKWIEYIAYKVGRSTSFVASFNLINSSSPFQEAMSLGPREQTEKIKLEVIEKALHFNPNNKELMKLYLETIPNVHPSDHVTKLIEDLIAKDSYNFTYWNHLLNNHQSSMSCEAENALKLYEKSMKVMRKDHDSDPQMLMLFKSCCLFLRQSGSNEKFFAIIQLMMNLNINSSDELDRIFYTTEVQNPHLNEYEDLVLKSDLPMNELWWRMETLRSICNFLPVRTSSDGKMDDPQRFVFNEDICNLVNPLKNGRAYNFDLFIIILRLLKLPLPYRDVKNEIFATNDREIECGMEFLSVLLEKTVSCDTFNRILFNVIKDLNISPNYLNFNVEYEPYLELVSKILIACSSSFNERQNKIVLILWLRLQRLIVIMDKLKLLAEKKEQSSVDMAKYKKQIKTKVKNVLKTSKYQNDLNVFREYALIEKSLGDEKSCENILTMAMETASSSGDAQSELDFYQIAIEFCEIKLTSNDKEICMKTLRKLAGDSGDIKEFFTSKISDDVHSDDDSNDIEECFLSSSNRLNLIKAKVFYLLLTSKRSALEEILRHINVAGDKSRLLEKLFELYVWMFHLRLGHEEAPSMRTYMETISKALEAFPRNLFILHSIAAHSSLRWFDIRKLLLKTPTTESIFYLLLASKYREEKFNDEENVMVYKHRIYNTIDGLMNRKGSRISSILVWRIYLRAAFSYDFSKCKRILYQTLDQHPMMKQLYLDGARYLPEEHSQLLDLIVEKGLRVHALAEELEILRTQSIL